MIHPIIIFASGKGSNAAAIIEYFKNKSIAKVALIVSNKENAGVVDLAKAERIPYTIIDRASFQEEGFVAALKSYRPSIIVLAGFLWKIPDNVIAAFSNRIINIHPALLPEFGGKGMYGGKVHNAVLEAGKKETGITIHYVDEVYDNGAIIMQARCKIDKGDVGEILAARIHRLEHFYFPRTIEFLLMNVSENRI